MKTAYYPPRLTVMYFRSSFQLLAGSGGRGVAADGSTIDFSGYRTGGDASSAAARGSSFWDEEE